MKVFLGILSFIFVAAIAVAATPILDLRAIDETVSPCTNFYQYACGAWQKNTPLPSHKSIIYRQSEELEDQSWLELKSLIEKSEPSSALNRFYQACMIQPKQLSSDVRKLLQRIQSIQNLRELAYVTGQLHTLNINVFFGFTTWQDLTNPKRTIVFLTQGGMALPEREYYLKQDKEARVLRRKYQDHVAEILRLSKLYKYLPSLHSASDIVSLEKSLAEKALSLEDQWTPSTIKNKISLGRLKHQINNWDWNSYFAGLGLRHQPRQFNLNEPKFFARFNHLINTEDLTDLKNYLTWHLLHEAAPHLTKEFQNSSFAFWMKELNGIEQREPLWQSCVKHTGEKVRDLLGKSYVENLPDAQATKTAINSIIDQALKVFSESLSSIEWIDSQTAKGAQLKLDHFGRKVAFPDTWDSYPGLKVSENDRVRNLFATAQYMRKKEFARIDRNEVNKDWGMAPWEINAYYDPSFNEFAFPFGILRPPAFDLAAGDAINMGAFGALVGHEMLHAFDSDGSQYDHQGRAVDWWSEHSRQQFEARSQCLITQANAYEILPGLFVNGERTITENVADQGGIKMAYNMYLQRKRQRGETPNFGQLNGDQQFFVSFAQSWCVKQTEEYLRTLLSSDVHGPAEFRVNISVMNRPEFAQVFACRTGDPMVPANRCDIW